VIAEAHYRSNTRPNMMHWNSSRSRRHAKLSPVTSRKINACPDISRLGRRRGLILVGGASVLHYNNASKSSGEPSSPTATSHLPSRTIYLSIQHGIHLNNNRHHHCAQRSLDTTSTPNSSSKPFDLTRHLVSFGRVGSSQYPPGRL
jgi:hypothetical protein